MSKLPVTKVEKVTAPLEVPIGLPDPAITDERLVEAFKRQGLVDLSRQTIEDVAAIGISLKGAGILLHQRGRALITQERADEAMRAIIGQMNKRNLPNKTLVSMAHVLATLTRSITDSQRLAVEIETLVAGAGGGPPEEPPAPVKSFPAGASVTPQVHVKGDLHIHQNGNEKQAITVPS